DTRQSRKAVDRGGGPRRHQHRRGAGAHRGGRRAGAAHPSHRLGARRQVRGGPHRPHGDRRHRRGGGGARHHARRRGRGGDRLAGAPQPQDGHGDQHPQPGVAQLPPARPDRQRRQASLHAGQRRELRHLRRVVAGRGAGDQDAGGLHLGHRHRRRDRAERRDLPRVQRRGRRDRPHDHRQQRPQVQVRQLRLPGAVRQRPRHRRARGGGDRGRRRVAAGGDGGRQAGRRDRRHRLRGRRDGRPVRHRGDEGNGQVPGRRRRQHDQHPEPRDGGDRGRRHPRRRPPVHPPDRRGAPPRLPLGPGVLPHRPRRAAGHGGGGGCRGGVQEGELRVDV
ncbi:MAG: Sugar kinase and transcription regulator, partial [uncultured Gemmatimonadetes bacterium]